VTPVLNGARTLPAPLASVRGQTQARVERVVVRFRDCGRPSGDATEKGLHAGYPQPAIVSRGGWPRRPAGGNRAPAIAR
jgi:hypothetical protein